ncbi:BRO family protein [Nevskia sp.]|uniref:BRO family protein n=1 Tax=Nevskia sp. TaxID=1929292 RepID=UPI003F6E9A4B
MTITNSLTTSAEFSGLIFTIHDHSGSRWITSTDVGKALGYAQPDNVTRVYRNHADEFTAGDTCTSVSEVQGQRREVRLFSATGCVLLSMFANTPRAKDFRAWAKRVLAQPAAVAPVATPSSIEHHLAEISRHMASLTAVSAQQARKLEVTGRYISLLELNQRGSVKVTPALAAEVHSLSAQGMPQADIARLLRTSATTVNRLLKGTYPSTQALPGGAALTPLSVETALEQAIASEAARLTGGAR